MKPRFFLPALPAAIAPVLSYGAAHACAVCVAGGGADDPLTDAFNWSVLFLMAMPYSVIGSVAGFLFYSHWRGAKKAGGKTQRELGLSLALVHKESGK